MSSTPVGFPLTTSGADGFAAPTLLMIHGFLDDASVWDGLVDSLNGEVATVRYDLPGFGSRSASVKGAVNATLESLTAEAGEVLAGIDGPVIVVGQSLGSQIAALVAVQHRDRVQGLVLLTPVPVGGTHLPAEAVAPFRALGGDRAAQRTVRAELSPNMSELQRDQLTEIGLPAHSDVVTHYVDVWNDGVTYGARPSEFDGSVLIVRGGVDAFVTEQLVNDIAERFAQSEVKVIDNGGHWLHVEYPEKLAAMILDFADAETEPPS